MKALILGGGISGLSAAWYLHRKDPSCQITLIEKEKRLGGWIRTEKQGDATFELGPRTFQYGKCPHLLQLTQDLGLDVQVSPMKKRHLLYQGKLRSLGSFWPYLLPHLIRQPFLRKESKKEETIYEFAVRRFSPWVAETFFDPLTLGVYAGDMRKLSMRCCFPQFQKGKGLFSVVGGMERIIERIAERVPMQIVHAEVEKLQGNAVWAGGLKWEADQIFCALPAASMNRLTGMNLPSRSLWVVTLLFQEDLFPKDSFGYLIPTREKESILGVVFDSPRLATVMIRSEEEKPLDAAFLGARQHLGIHQSPLFTSVFLARDAIPQFEIGHAEKIARMEASLKPIHLLGNYLQGVSVEASLTRSFQRVLK